MKQLVILIVSMFVFAGLASAHEGNVDLVSSKVSCKGVSIYQDGVYKVSGRCDGLVYPYETLYNKYVLWGKTSVRGESVRIAEIDRGYFSGSISNAFDGMFVTAEKDSLVRRPSDVQIVAGKVNVFDFDKSQVTSASTTTTETTATTTTNTKPAVATTTSTAGAVVGKIVSSLLVVILVIVVLAIGASLLFRNRGSVST